ncbi:MAG: hypothetical protein WBO77_01125 [Microgenomates group bacterium]
MATDIVVEKNEESQSQLSEDLSAENWDTRLSDTFRSLGANPYQLNLNEFLDRLYVERKVQTKLRQDLRTTQELICLVGSKGTGKSSVLAKMRHELTSNTLERSHVLLIDLRHLHAAGLLGPDSDIEKNIISYVRDCYLDDLFNTHNVRDGIRPRDTLRGYLLDPHPGKWRRPETLFVTQRKLREDAQFLRSSHARERNVESFKSIQDWLIACEYEPSLRNLVVKLEESTLVVHLVCAARDIYGFARQYIWFDNADKIPAGRQASVIETIRNLQTPLVGIVNTLVAIREENIYREILEDWDAPPRLYKIRIEKNGQEYFAQDVNVVAKETVTQLLVRRMEYTRDLQRTMSIKLGVMLDAQNQRTLTASAAEVPEIADQIRQLRIWTSVYGHPLSDDIYRQLIRLSEIIIIAFHREGAIYLANSDLRDVQMMHRDILGRLIEARRRDPNDYGARKCPTWYVSTLILDWMRRTLREYQVGFYDVISDCEEWHANEGRGTGCNLSHLIITSAWNMAMMRDHCLGQTRQLREPDVGEICTVLSYIGYDSYQVKAELYRLFFQNESRNNAIEIRSKDVLKSPSMLQDDTRVYATELGKAIAGLATTSFGYLYGCYSLQRDDKRAKNVGEMPSSDFDSPRISDFDHAIDEMIPFLERIMIMHLSALERIRDTLLSKDELAPMIRLEANGDWFIFYLRYFGTPQVDPFSRRAEIGFQTSRRTRHALHLEAMLSGLAVYAGRRNMVSQSKVLGLKRRYLEHVTELR